MGLLKTFIPLMIGLVMGCRSASDEVVEKFKEVNESLERSNKMMDSTMLGSDRRTDSAAQDLKSVGFDPAVADSLGHLFIQTIACLIRIKSELKNADSTGENLDAAKNLLIKSPKGDSLFNYMTQVYEAGMKYGDSTSLSYLNDLRNYSKDKWLERYFKMVPTFAAITILSKFQNDLGNIKMAIMYADREKQNKLLSK